LEDGRNKRTSFHYTVILPYNVGGHCHPPTPGHSQGAQMHQDEAQCAVYNGSLNPIDMAYLENNWIFNEVDPTTNSGRLLETLLQRLPAPIAYRSCLVSFVYIPLLLHIGLVWFRLCTSCISSNRRFQESRFSRCFGKATF
jgi:hypothetical protein